MRPTAAQPDHEEAPRRGRAITRGSFAEAELWHQFAATRDTATRQRLIENYIPLAKRIVGARIRCMVLTPATDAEDLMSVGLLALVEAVDRYDPKNASGARFNSFATTWIRGRVLNAINADSILPKHITSNVAKVRRVNDELSLSLGRVPTFAEVASKADVYVNSVAALLGPMGVVPVSLDAPLGDPDGSAFGSILPADVPPPEAHVEAQQRELDVHKAILTLPDRWRVVAQMRFLDGAPLQEVADALGVTRERVRQVEFKVKRALRVVLGRMGYGPDGAA